MRLDNNTDSITLNNTYFNRELVVMPTKEHQFI